MKADHIFIFTDDNGKIADQLVEFGLTEGSNRFHVGKEQQTESFTLTIFS